LPKEILAELSNKLSFLINSWLDTQNILQRPVQPGETPPTSGSNATKTTLTPETRSRAGEKRASMMEMAHPVRETVAAVMESVLGPKENCSQETLLEGGLIRTTNENLTVTALVNGASMQRVQALVKCIEVSRSISP
jgi:hypothetical protein